jgi:hypothetical protein
MSHAVFLCADSHDLRTRSDGTRGGTSFCEIAVFANKSAKKKAGRKTGLFAFRFEPVA